MQKRVWEVAKKGVLSFRPARPHETAKIRRGVTQDKFTADRKASWSGQALPTLLQPVLWLQLGADSDQKVQITMFL